MGSFGLNDEVGVGGGGGGSRVIHTYIHIHT